MIPAAGWVGAGPVNRPSPIAPTVLLAGVALTVSAALPPGAQYFCALAAIIVLGVPHGALDGEAARTVLRPRFGRAWFPVFSLPYLGLSALVLLAWHWAPGLTLAAFLAASVWHFGTEDAKVGDGFEVIARGGLPIAMPTLAHPQATAAVFQTAARAPLPQLPDWLWAAALAWFALALVWAGQAALRRQGRLLAGPGLLAAMFIALPPLTAFAIYFVGVHAPAHTLALIRNPVRAPRVRDDRSAALLALPITALTLLIGAALWPLYGGAAPDRLLALTLQGLAALTLPHMLLDAGLARRERRASAPA
jgi:Brp/Blh family beta-carotene 15,15'-monooxygenase